ncbi:PREDICTED: uncharacterized protein LOC106110097 [Papilio polytes]|uniref:uncharacterized protein LOC106110097 n=1 Tax=Papilio polytes TaxID=76194 RepID=UPI0006760D69|nr:PREDICTED: uncharacterized protein LOC106110097 [Papilio polytes]
MSPTAALLVFLALSVDTDARAEHVSICDSKYCACSQSEHPSWTSVNCTVPANQKLDILEGDLPSSTSTLTITGAEAVQLGANSLSRLVDARFIQIYDTKIILMRKFTGVKLAITSLMLDIDRCDVLRIEENTFSSIKGPLSVSIKNCDVVSFEGEAFSWLLSMEISNVRKLQLGKGSFTLDPTAANVGEHGPGMTVKLKNVGIPEIPEQAFGSSAAEIRMEAVDTSIIRWGAFSANTFNVVIAINCSIRDIEGEAFAQKSMINYLRLHHSKVHHLSSNALQSAIVKLEFTNNQINIVDTGAINATAIVAVTFENNEFHHFQEKGFVLTSCNKFYITGNSFDNLPPFSIIAPGSTPHELQFSHNEIETLHENSLVFIGNAYTMRAPLVFYGYNYYGHPCHCNFSDFLGKALGYKSGEPFENDSYCTVDEVFARCFNVPEQNMQFTKFKEKVCTDQDNIECEAYRSKKQGQAVEIKNPRFPHKHIEDEGLSDRDKKVIGIVIVTILGCVIIVMIISLIRCMKRRGYCLSIKNILSSNSPCGSFCERVCGVNNGLDNARSISQLSIHEYSERRRLNEPREMVQETALPFTEQVLPMDDKMTQTLPEELTKELLENLKEKLEDPENYVEAREMIEHLYELIKVEESCNTNSPTIVNVEENIYELPFQNTTPRIGKNKKPMISVGTRTPSLDKLLPLSPYNRQTALAHEYFEPKDFAVHLYAEIANCGKERKNFLGVLPDVLAEQPVPRGPYLRAVRDKMNSSSSSSPSVKSISTVIQSPQHNSTIKSNKSTASNNSGKMMNRPLPEKPVFQDPGEGTSLKLG